MNTSKTIVIIVLGLTTSLLGQADENIAAKILSVQGQVEVATPDVAPAQVGQILYAGDIIRTGPRSRAALLMADETQLKLSANSELELTAVRPASSLLVRVVEAGPEQSILNMRRGRAWIRSKRTPAAVRVQTPAVTAAIRGTEFDVQVGDDGETLTTVVEGSVDFFNELGSIIIDSGEQGSCLIGQAPTKTVILNPEDAVQWSLYYSASVSPRDYPFYSASAEQALAQLEGGGLDALTQAQLQHDAGQLDAALESLAGQDSSEANETRGWIYLEQNRLREAIEQFGQAAATSPRTRLGMSIAHYRTNELQEAYRYVEDPGNDGRLITHKAMLEMLGGEIEMAQLLLESIVPGDPAYSLGRGLLSNVLLAQNDKEGALRAAQDAIDANSESPSAHLNHSLVQQSYFDLPAATRSAERALGLDPNFLQAQVQYAKLLFGAGRTGQAQEIVEQALASSPEEASVHSLLGFIQLSRGETSEAVVSLERSVQLDSSRGEPHLGLGIAAMRQGLTTNASLECLEAATLEPQFSLYQSYLAKAFWEMREFEQSLTALATAIELDPQDPTPHLYSGIFAEDLNRPVVAVDYFQESIRLNDNRAVYRSRFLLDEDRAVRNIGLARAYNRLGLAESANLEAIKSNVADATNSSARIFMADTFLNLDGRTTAGGSELLMARLLLPVNPNSFNAFNDYTTVFEGTRVNTTFQGSLGNLNSWSLSPIVSGGVGRFAFGSIFTRDATDGFRETDVTDPTTGQVSTQSNDFSKSYTTFNLFKFAPSAHSDILFSYSHTQTQQGDRGLATPLVTPDNDLDLNLFTRVHRAELGYHHQLQPGSELLIYFSGRTSDLVQNNQDATRVFRTPRSPGFPAAQRVSNRDPNLSLQATHIWKFSDVQLKYGIDLFDGRSRSRSALSFCIEGPQDPTDPQCVFSGDPPGDFEEQEFDVDRRKGIFRTVFLQSDFTINPKLIFTAGLSYDWAKEVLAGVDQLFDDETGATIDDVEMTTDQVNPQAGILFTPLENSTFRFAYARTTQTHAQERLVPTHINGFVLSPNEAGLTRGHSFHTGWDQRLFGGKTFLRTTGFYRNREIPTIALGASMDFTEDFIEGDFYGGRFVVNQIVKETVTLVLDYSVIRDDNIFGLRHDHDFRIAAFFIHPSGFDFRIEEEFLYQGRDFVVSDTTNVWTTNLFMRYELSDKLGALSLELTNLFDRRYTYLADPLALDPRVPRRQVRFQLEFFF